MVRIFQKICSEFVDPAFCFSIIDLNKFQINEYTDKIICCLIPSVIESVVWFSDRDGVAGLGEVKKAHGEVSESIAHEEDGFR